MTVLTRPRELTRKQLRELRAGPRQAGFTEANLATAWREMTNQDIAARIVGYIRQAAIGDPLVPYEQRVDGPAEDPGLAHLDHAPAAMAAEDRRPDQGQPVVDRDALDDPDLIFKREGGGFSRLDQIFDGELQQVLETFNDSLWPPAA